VTPAVRTTIFLWALLFLVSCGLLIDIPDGSGITCCPDTANQVLSEQEIPHICFDFAVNKFSVEALFSVEDAAGELPGFFQWEDQTVSFQPQPQLIPGRRYTFSFVGAYRDLRGVEYTAHRIVPFYYKQRDGSAPYLLSSVPASGQIIASDQMIRIQFSEAIDPSSLAKGLNIQPDTPVAASWENGTTELVLKPQENWEHCQCYTIEITEELRDSSGIPLAEPRELVFWVQGDVESPRVLLVEPAFNLPARLYPSTGYDVGESVGLADVLRIRFSEAMDTGSTAGALILIPSVTTERVWIDAVSLVVVPTGGFAADTEYLLDFDSRATDRAGNAIEMPEPIQFATIPGAITVITDLVQDGIQLGPGDYSTATAVEIQPYPISSSADYELLFHFTGAGFDSNAEKYAVLEAISLLCIFPDSGVANPIATGYSWMGDIILSVTYSELQPSTATRKVYYLLCIRGGPSGIATDEGYRLQQDLEQLLVTAVE
jgi:hypothetical protein